MKTGLVFFQVMAFLSPILATASSDVESKLGDSRLKMEYRSGDSYIRRIVEKHEALFPNAMHHNNIFYFTPLSRVSRVQQQVLTEFANDPDFSKVLKERGELADFSVTVGDAPETGATVREINPVEWVRFRYHISSIIQNRFMKLTQNYNRIPTAAELLKDFRRELREVEWKYRAPHMDTIGGMASHLTAYIMFASVAKQFPNETAAQIEGRLLATEEGAIDYLHDSTNYSVHLQEIFRHPSNHKEDLAALEELMPDIFYDWDKRFYSSSKVIKLKKGDTLSIREVPLDVAVLRGWVGNDCSTSYSPGFVFTPYDRYFYVFDGNTALGYAGLSRVNTVEGKKALFLHTIQGPNFTAEQTHMVIAGFMKSARALGVDEVLLGPDNSIDANVNFKAISSTMMESVKGQTPIKLEWLDWPYRRLIASRDSTLRYDNPETNHSGRRPQIDTEAIEVSLRHHPMDMSFINDFKKEEIKVEEKKAESETSLKAAKKTDAKSGSVPRRTIPPANPLIAELTSLVNGWMSKGPKIYLDGEILNLLFNSMNSTLVRHRTYFDRNEVNSVLARIDEVVDLGSKDIDRLCDFYPQMKQVVLPFVLEKKAKSKGLPESVKQNEKAGESAAGTAETRKQLESKSPLTAELDGLVDGWLTSKPSGEHPYYRVGDLFRNMNRSLDSKKKHFNRDEVNLVLAKVNAVVDLDNKEIKRKYADYPLLKDAIRAFIVENDLKVFVDGKPIGNAKGKCTAPVKGKKS